MADAGRPGRGDEGGTYQLTDWDAIGQADLIASGRTEQDVLVAALSGLLVAANGDRQPTAAEEAVPIRGDGSDLGALFADIGADLLSQLDANGPRLTEVRLDGLLRTDEGLTAWGYALGDVVNDPPMSVVAFDRNPLVTQQDDQIVLRTGLRRTGDSTQMER